MTEIIHDVGMDPGFVEGETTQITFTITEAGSGLVPTNLWVTIYDEATGTIINSRSRVALSPVPTYVSPAGVLTFNLDAADCVLLNTDTVKHSEVHRIIFEFNWLAGARVGFLLGRWTVQSKEKQPDA